MSRIDKVISEAKQIGKAQTSERQRLIKSQNVGASVVLKMVLDDEWDEYIIQFWKNGKHDEKKDYFSGGNDASAKQDAERTMASMAKEIVQKGLDK